MRLSHEPQWEKSFTERNENQVKRFRNHASIVMWSMGNESGNGNNFSTAEKVNELEAYKKMREKYLLYE